jgi:hypothetical protein
MDVTQVMAYELDNQRIGIWKSENGDYIVTNTLTGKSLLCISCEEALDVFDYCLTALRGTNLMN